MKKGCITIFAVFCLMILILFLNQNHHRNRAYIDGQNAAQAGLSAECNPYKDYCGTAWLEGWASKKK
jgi:ribosome modulation factor